MIEEGVPAPDFEARADDGSTVRLSDLRGKPVVLFFYPKDDTPGCTTQACGLRDVWHELSEHGIQVLGVSRDDADSHTAFKQKLELPFPLLVDVDRKIGDAYGIENYNDVFDVYKRSTVVIDADGNVAKVLPDVDASTHADEVLSLLAPSAG
jgi:thioredoxin-dependent peroxiredoxin